MARTRYKPEIKRNQSFTLNITSMTDMFTIMLVFLLQSFAAGEVQIDTVPGLRLPTSNTEKNPVDGVKISLSKEELRFDQKTLARIENKRLDPKALDAKDSNFIRPLFAELEGLNKQLEKDKSLKVGKVLLQADQELPYEVIRQVMYTASMAGFPNLKLVTTVGD